MAEVCNLPQYPKQSCQTCSIKEPVGTFFQELPKGVPEHNLLGNDNNIPEMAEFLPSSNQVYGIENNPTLVGPNGKPVRPNTHILNRNFGLKYATDFVKTNCPKCIQGFSVPPVLQHLGVSNQEACPNGMYVSADPRIRNFAIGQTIPLDAPPFTGDVKLQDVYSPSLTNYGQGTGGYGQYKSYKDINAGQIQYYTTNELSDPLFKPVFTIESQVTKSVFKDPMDNYTPQYNRVPLTNKNNNISGYQWDRDQIGFREDLISKQLQSGRYRTDWQMHYNNH